MIAPTTVPMILRRELPSGPWGEIETPTEMDWAMRALADKRARNAEKYVSGDGYEYALTEKTTTYTKAAP